MVYEWRGALFRVRLARLRLAGEPPPPGAAAAAAAAGSRRRSPRRALTIGGTAAFAVGATVGPWPLWVAGMIAVCLSLLVYRP